MNLRRPRRRGDLVNITPLIDVVFILLVFFMLAGAIEKPEAFDVAPPVSDAPVKGDIQDLVVLIGGDGALAVDDEAVSRGELASMVRAIMAAAPSTLIQIKADAGVDADTVIAVMELMQANGVEYLVLLAVGAGGPA